MPKLTKLNELIAQSKRQRGHWQVGKNNEIWYRAEGKDEEFTLKGTLLSAEPGQLVVSFTEKQTDQRVVTGIVKLAGDWRVDGKNNLVFEVQRQSGRKDVLNFTGAWKVGKDNELIYSYEEARLKTKVKRTRALVFSGYWDMNERQRLTYVFGGDTNSVFRFRGAWQTKSILAKEGQIRYQLGSEVRAGRGVQTLIIFGKWKLSHDLALSFDVHYGQGRKRSMIFGGEYRINKEHQIELSLTTAKGRSLGIEVVLTREFLISEGQAFLRLRKSFEESRIEAGVRLKW